VTLGGRAAYAFVLASSSKGLVRPVLRATMHGVKASTHVHRPDLGHRYGHIIRPNDPHP
jgi:hypothetical protein